MSSSLSIETLILLLSGLIVASLFLSRLLDNLGLPALILFLAAGMFAGPGGFSWISFQNLEWARAIGVSALVLILFSGGLETDMRAVRPYFGRAASLSTIGVIITSVVVGLAAWKLLGLPPWTGFLLGAILASTDAAAVFAILRGRELHLRSGIKPLLELESGTNDPMAIFLTVVFLELALGQGGSIWRPVGLFAQQMTIGAAFGVAGGLGLAWAVNRLRFVQEGLTNVSSLAFAFFLFSVTDHLHGSGFLAVYMAGMIASSRGLVQKKSLIRFWDGQAWLSQVILFLVLGLLVAPRELPGVLVPGLWISMLLMFVARPAAVFLSLLFVRRMGFREKLFISWTGIRGAVPIILATFPLVKGLPEATTLFHMVFFVVVLSTLLQGVSLPWVARWLGVSRDTDAEGKSPIEFQAMPGLDAETQDYIVPFQAEVAGRTIAELQLPDEACIVLLCRDGKFLVPAGATTLRELDVLTVLHSRKQATWVGDLLSKIKVAESGDGKG